MRRNKAPSLPPALCSSVVLLPTPQKRQAGKELVRRTQARFDSLIVPRGSSTKTILKILAPGTRSCPRYPEFLLPMIGGFFLWRVEKRREVRTESYPDLKIRHVFLSLGLAGFAVYIIHKSPLWT